MKKNLVRLFCLLMTISLLGQNRVLLLDGDGDFVSLPQPILDTQTFTIEAWYYLNGDGGGVEQQNFIFSQRAENTGCYHSAIALVAKARPDLPHSSIWLRTDQDCGSNATNTNIAYGEWHHLAGVLEAGEIKLYRDGYLVATTAYIPQGSFVNAISTVEIGRHHHDNQAFGYFFGMIDEVRIWDYALPASEINASMGTVLDGDEQGLLAYWNFNDSTASDLTGMGNDGVLTGDAGIVFSELTNQGDGLIAAYPFEGNADDVSGNNIHGVVEGASLTEDRFGNQNSAYYFDGQNDVISLGNDPLLSPDHITVSAWFSSTSQALGSPATQFILRNKLWGYSLSFNPYVDLQTPHIGGLASMFYLDDGNTFYKFVSEETSYNDGDWHFLAASYNGSIYTVYIDGQPVYQDSSNAEAPLHYEPWVTTIGRGGDEWANAFEGKIDEVKIYNYALTAEEINAAYHVSDWDLPLIAHYPFDGNANDSSSYGQHGTPSGGVDFDHPDRFGKLNSAVYFDGVDDVVTTDFDYFTEPNKISVSMWLKLQTTENEYEFILRSESGLGVWQIGHQIKFVMSQGATNNASVTVNTDTWVHFVGTYDGEYIRAYLDGDLVSETAHNVNISYFGSFLSFGYFSEVYWDGLMDDVMIFNHALSPETVSNIYREGLLELEVGFVEQITGNNVLSLCM